MRFFKRKQEKSTRIEIPLKEFAQQAAFDTRLMSVQEINSLLEFPPMSDEVADMEHDASEDRLSRLEPMHSMLVFHSALIGDLSAKTHAYVTNEDLSEEEMGELRLVYSAVALSATSSLLSVLYSYGLVDIMGVNPKIIDGNTDE
jgi:hypothetical protein